MMANEKSLKKRTMQSLAWSSIVAFGVYGAGAGATYLCQLVIARSIGPESYGIYAYVFAWVTILAYLVALGFDVSLLRLVSAYKAFAAWDLMRGVIRYAERRSAVAGLAIVIGGLTVIALLRSRLTPELTETFLIGFLIIPVLALLWIRASQVRAFGGIILALAPDRLVRDSMLLMFVCCLIVFRPGRLGAPAVMATTLLSAIIGLALVSWGKQRLWPVPANGEVSMQEMTEWNRTAFPLVVIAVAEAAINRTGVMSLGWAGHASDAGVYALIFNVTSIVVLPRIAVNTRFAPMVSEFFARGDQASLQHLITRGASWTLIGAASLAVPLFFLAGPILAWFGPDFEAAVLPMRILLLSQVIAASAGSQIFLMTMTGQERSAAIVVVLTAAGNFVLTVPLIHFWGTTGAAIASAVALLLWNVMMAIVINRNLGAMPGVFAVVFQRGTFRRQSEAIEIPESGGLPEAL
jgi:O-antigen/teichoic acid export membrane protein